MSFIAPLTKWVCSPRKYKPLRIIAALPVSLTLGAFLVATIPPLCALAWVGYGAQLLAQKLCGDRWLP